MDSKKLLRQKIILEHTQSFVNCIKYITNEKKYPNFMGNQNETKLKIGKIPFKIID